jgi:hypothetical protein
MDQVYISGCDAVFGPELQRLNHLRQLQLRSFQGLALDYGFQFHKAAELLYVVQMNAGVLPEKQVPALPDFTRTPEREAQSCPQAAGFSGWR